MGLVEVSGMRVVLAFLLAIIPLGVLLWFRVPLVGRTVVALARMAAQLVFVGLYLTVVFRVDRWWLTLLWLLVMVAVADLSVIRGCGLRIRSLGGVLLFSLLVGTLLPMLYFTGVVLERPDLLEAQYAIPLGGMVLGNCLRADIIGMSRFFEGMRDREEPFLLALAQGATLGEALAPYYREALQAALAPTIATISTVGLVSLPGMMTGVILTGADPMEAIKYQIVIMLAILAGTAITLGIALRLARHTAFNPFGLLDERVFAEK